MRSIRTLAGAASTLAVAIATPVFAQSTGTLDFDKEIVVTAKKVDKGIAGVVIPDTSKATEQLDSKWISRELGGQAINDTINMLPGVSFQNNDPFGAAGGTLTIRGFDSTRISETMDGMTLNDDGNYALYPGEMLDSEVIDSVRVNLGTTDVDSPTASASGSTINTISHMPSDNFHYTLKASGGSYDYYRAFGMVDTGVFTAVGTKAWFSASKTGNSSPYNNYGQIKKEEYNGKIYQPIGANGFVWVAGFYATLRNNFSGYDPLSNVQLAADNGTGFRVFPTSYANSFYTYAPCTVTNSSSNTCGTAYDYRPNPDNIGNLRAAIKLPITDKLTFTADPSYQFNKANGGGTSTAKEAYGKVGTDTTATGYINGTYYLGENLLNDGMTGTVPIYVPSETVTHRIALTTSLIYEIARSQSLRVSYALSDSAIRQTGEASVLTANGSPQDVFAVDTPLIDGNGNVIEKRDEHSIAALNQVSGEYRGKFLDDRLSLNLGVRAPFLTRNLTNFCYTRSNASAFTCIFDATQQAAYSAAYPTYSAPQTRSFHYHAVLPNVGLTFKLPANAEFFANYSKGMQAPSAAALYQSFFFAPGTVGAAVKSETADNLDAGLRYSTSRLQAQIDLWYTHFVNKLDTAQYDPQAETSIYANMGPIQRYGVDANLSYKVDDHISAYVFGSALHSKIEQNIDAGPCSAYAAYAAIGVLGCGTGATEAYYQTAGKFEAAIPKYTLGGRLQGSYGIFSGGVEVKRTGPRYVNAQNTPMYSMGSGLPANGTEVYSAETPAYTVVNLDVKVDMASAGWPERSFVQLNVTNLFNQFYVGGFSQVYANTQTLSASGGTSPNLLQAQVSPPRAIVGTIAVAF